MKQILIIEDEAILARNLAITMERAGLDVRIAASAVEARERLAGNQAGLICADIALGDGDGIDVVASYRRDHPDIPVVIMTGRSRNDNEKFDISLTTDLTLTLHFLGVYRQKWIAPRK